MCRGNSSFQAVDLNSIVKIQLVELYQYIDAQSCESPVSRWKSVLLQLFNAQSVCIGRRLPLQISATCVSE